MALRLEVVSSFPSHAPGRAIYHTGNKMAYVSDGSSWMPFASPQLTKTYTPGTTNRTIEEGYHKGSIVKGDANLIAGNIKKNVQIFGVQGSHDGYVCPINHLYYRGNECVPWSNGYMSDPAFRDKSHSAMVFLVSYSGSDGRGQAAYRTTSRISLTGINSIKAIVAVNGSNQPDFYLIASTSSTGSSGTYDARARVGSSRDGLQIVSLDVSELTGLYYIRLHLVSGSSYTSSAVCFAVWME